MSSNRSRGEKSTLQTLVDDTLSTRVVTEVDRVQDNMPVSFGFPGEPGAYSVRSAAIGVIRVARRAGNQVARSAAAASTIGAMVKASGSSAPTS